MNEEQHQKRNLAYYENSFRELKVYKSNKKGGYALNKPILLLSVIDLIAQSLIKENVIMISNELIETFNKYWTILVDNNSKSTDIVWPFFHLKNSPYKFWHLKYSSNYEGKRPKSLSKLKRDIEYAFLDQELFILLQEPYSRQYLVDSILIAWFSASKKRLEEILMINEIMEDYANQEYDFDDLTQKLQKPTKMYLKKSVIRNAFFRKAIVYLYEYRCAFCRLKVIDSINQSIVDGAHIKPFSEFYDNRVNNGISLCKNHHWAFDVGLFAINSDYKILISQEFQEESPYGKSMKSFAGETIYLPKSDKCFPLLEAIEWHRKNKFKN